jgi:hypothetical protein
VKLSLDMGIPLSRLLDEATSADIAEYQAYYMVLHQEQQAAKASAGNPVATPGKPISASEGLRAMFGHRVKKRQKDSHGRTR